MPDGSVAMPEKPSNRLVTLADASTEQRVAANQIPLPPPTIPAMLVHEKSEPHDLEKKKRERENLEVELETTDFIWR